MRVENVKWFLFTAASALLWAALFLSMCGCATTSKSSIAVKSSSRVELMCGEVNIPCEKEKNPKPVCFSCEEVVRILKAKERLRAWPERCRIREKQTREIAALDCKRRLDSMEAMLVAERKKNHALTPSPHGWVVPALIGLGIGFGVGALVFSLTR